MAEERPVVSRQVELLEKNKPQQERAIKTYEGILLAAGELLTEVGLERISTNLIAERAGVTVPALYRYFPNKYAVLNALGARLMDAQNLAFLAWHEQYVADKPPESMMENLGELLRVTYEASLAIVGGVEIIRCMECLGPLRETRLASHWSVADGFGQLWSEQYGVPYTEKVAQRARMAVNIGFSAMQVALEDDRLDPAIAIEEGGNALRCYLRFVAREAGIKLD